MYVFLQIISYEHPMAKFIVKFSELAFRVKVLSRHINGRVRYISSLLHISCFDEERRHSCRPRASRGLAGHLSFRGRRVRCIRYRADG